MGRPRVVHSAEEQAALDEQRRQHARERARARRADPALRAAETEAQRQPLFLNLITAKLKPVERAKIP